MGLIPSSHTLALWLTQPLTEMSTRNISFGGFRWLVHRIENLNPSCANCLKVWEPQPPGTLRVCNRPVQKLLYISYVHSIVPNKFTVHSVQQKSCGLIFCTSCSGSDMTCICHHNSSHFTFPILVHSWCFSVFYSFQLITPRIY